jgi:hypothetical protein
MLTRLKGFNLAMSMVILRMIGKLYEKVLKISALEKLKA